MGDLVVRPSFQLGPRDILTVDKINLMATPVVELALADPVNDQNFFRNGNMYSSFWTDPLGIVCPAGVDTTNADYWTVTPVGDSVTCKRSSVTPDIFSLFSAELDGNTSTGICEFGQAIIADLAATMRRKCTFSGYIQNNTGLTMSPVLNVYTCNVFNNVNDVTLQETLNLPTIQNGEWGYETAAMDLTAVPNVANGLVISVVFPAGTLNGATKIVRLSRLKFQIGEIATEFVDDTSLFVTAPSVDASMLQDGCIARPGLFLDHVVRKGAYVLKSIANGDIDDKAIDARCLADGTVAGALGYTPVNKAGDTAVGAIGHTVDTVVGADSGKNAAVVAQLTDPNKANDGYFPAIGLVRDPAGTRRSIGLTVDNRLKTVDGTGAVGYIGDSITKLDTSFYQDKSITLEKLADELIKLLISPGIIQAFAGPTPPTGWLVCDGSAVRRVDFPALFTAIGTYWGAGDNISTFNVPDLRGRSVLGYVTAPIAGITGRALGSLGGAETTTLTVGQMPSHAHTVIDNHHGHNVIDNLHDHGMRQRVDVVIGGGSGAANQGPAGTPISPGASNISIASAASNISLQPNGSGQAHSNMQPFGVAYYIIKT